MSGSHSQPESVLDCGGKRSATPLSSEYGLSPTQPKAPSPLRSAGAVQDASSPLRIAGIAAAFCLLVAGYMLYQHTRASERDPWKSPQLLALKEQLRAEPQNEAIKTEIRRLDLEFRQRYVRRLNLDRTGGWLLVGGMVVMLVAARQSAKLRALPWLPKLRGDVSAEIRTTSARARWSVAGIGLVTGASLLALALTATSRLPQSAAELDKLLGKSGAALDDLPTLAEFQVNTPRFRGWDGGGVAPAGFDLAFLRAPEVGVVWKSSVTAVGFNSPVAWGDRVFLSGGDAEKREVFCYDGSSGALLWQREVTKLPGSPARQPEIPEMTGFAAPTMATDGRRVFVMFGNGDLAAFTFDGAPVWGKNFGVPRNMYGQASSLAIWPGVLVVQLDQDEDAPGGSKLLAFDCATGRTIWERTKPTHGSWSSPVIIEADGKPQIITLALPFVMSHALADGAELWRAELMSGEIAPSPIFAGGFVFVVSPSGELFALRADGAGDVSKTHVAWRALDNIPDITSPVSNGELVFTVTTMGGLACFEATTGKLLWQHELEVEVQASPAIVGNELLVVSTHGDLIVAAVAREFIELARVKLEDEFHASPAFAAGRMFLRGAANLWCLGETK